MKVFAIVSGLILTLVLIVGLGCAVTYFSYVKSGVNYETRLNSTYEANQVILNGYTKKVQGMAQVPEMYKNDLKEIIDATFQGRYGKDGSKAVMSFINEKNMSLDADMYKQIQRVMESGENEFTTAQKTLIDVRNNYKAQLDYPWSGFWLSLGGFPKVDLAKYKTIVLDTVTTKFESGKDEVIKLR